MGQKFTDNALTTLASSITNVATTLSVAAGKGANFPQVVGKGTPGAALDFFVITMEDSAGNREKIKCEERPVGDALGSAGYPLIRGYDGTTARGWTAGDSVDLRIEKKTHQEAIDKVITAGLGHAFGIKDSTTTGLTFGYYGALLNVDGVATLIADGTLALTAGATNFIERDAAGTVSFNTASFSAGKSPLYQVVCGASQMSTITDKRADNRAIFGRSTKSLAAGGTIVLAADEVRAPILDFTGALASNTTVEMPNVKRAWIIRDQTTRGGFSLTVKVNGQPGIAIPTNGGEFHIYGNGTDIRRVQSADLLSLEAQVVNILASAAKIGVLDFLTHEAFGGI